MFDPTKTAQKIKEIYANTSIDFKSRLNKINEESRNFISSSPMSLIRNNAMLLLISINDILSIIENHGFHQILEQILVYYDTNIKITCKNESEMNAARFEKIDDKIWKNCFKIILNLDISKYQTEIDNLLHLKEPENQFRKDFIRSSILLMVYDENVHKFCKGIIFAAFCDSSSVIDDVFDTVIFKIYIYGHPDTIEPFLSTKELKLQYLNLLNQCLKNALNKQPQENVWAQKFVEKITVLKLPELIESESAKYNLRPDDTVETCILFGKVYQLITVATTKQLQNFVQMYFVQSKPKLIGLNTESNNGKLAILTLAANNWLCIIDMHLLPGQDWVKFFKHIFDLSSVIPVGFGFDFGAICNTFTYLKNYFAKQSRKILCISKLIQQIQQNPQAYAAVFSKSQLSGKSLKDVSDAILGGNLNKNLKSGSSWTQRPLTKEQKLYAVTDALVVILIKEKIEAMLKGKCNAATITKIFNDSYTYYGMKPITKTSIAKPSAKTVATAIVRPNIQPLMSVVVQPPPLAPPPPTPLLSNLCITTQISRSSSSSIKCKKCSSTNLTTIPSPLYILTHTIITMIKNGEYYGLAEWKELEKFALNVKNMSCTDYNGFKAKLLINDSNKPSKKVKFDCGNYHILPLTFQLIRRRDGKSFNLILSEKVLSGSKNGLCHFVCLDCANVFLKDENNQNKISNNAKKNPPKKHVVKEEVTRQKIFELLCDIFEH